MREITICVSDSHCNGIQPCSLNAVLTQSANVGGKRRAGVLLKVRDLDLQGEAGRCSPWGS